jgi:ketosteroid isomerase-like protein
MPARGLPIAESALRALDAKRIVQAYHDEFLFEDIPSRRQIRDRDELLGYFEALFSLPMVAFNDILIHESEDFAAIEWSWSGVGRNSGAPYRIRGASIIELRQGLIAVERLFYDPAAAA